MEEYLNNEFEGFNEEETLGNQELSDYNQAVTWGTDWTTETIVSQLKKGNIELNPEFQRRNAWNDEKRSSLIESLMLGIPVPQIILAENKEKKNSYIVIDGKQRLLALRHFFADKDDTQYKQLKLKGLGVITTLNGKTIDDIKEDVTINDFYCSLENQPIRTTIIKSWPNENFLYTIFFRLNTGSVKLSPQELRQALHPGPFLSYINEYTMQDNPIRTILKIKEPDKRMRDVELILRYFAFKNYLPRYKGSFKEFMDEVCKVLNNRWEEDEVLLKKQLDDLKESIRFTNEVFGQNSFRVFKNGDYLKLLNRTIFDVFTVYFSDESNRNKLTDKKEQVKTAFESLMTNDADFASFTYVTTQDKLRTEYRFDKFNSQMNNIE